MKHCGSVYRKSKTPKTGLVGFTCKVGALSLLAAAVVAVASMLSTMLGFAHPGSALNMTDTRRWSQEVKANVIKTYVCLFGSLFLCMVSAAFVFSQPLLFQIFSYPAMIAVDFVLEMYLQNGKLFCRLDNRGVLCTKNFAWILYCLFLGGLTSSAFLRGPEVTSPAIEIIYAVVAVLVFVSLNSPLGKYSGWRRYLCFAETCILVSSIGASLWPLTTFMGAFSFAFSFYGGLIVFPLFLLCHSQEAQLEASKPDEENQTPAYCAWGMFVPMLLDSLSIFSRLVFLIPSK